MSVATSLAIGFTGFVVYKAEPGSTLFSFHPALMTFAYSLLIFEGIQIYNKTNPLRKVLPIRLITYHWVVMTLALFSVCGGMFAVYQTKENKKKPHFESLHSQFGLVANSGLFLVAAGGVLALYRRGLGLPKLVKQAHIVLGGLIAIPALGAIVTGLSSNYFTNKVMGSPSGNWRVIYAMPVVCSFVILMQVALKLIKKNMREAEKKAEKEAEKREQEEKKKREEKKKEEKKEE